MFFFGRYGISDYTLTQKLVEHAKTFPPSFDPLAPRKYYYHYYYGLYPQTSWLFLCTVHLLFNHSKTLSCFQINCSSIFNTCALNRLQKINVQHIIFFPRWWGKKPASAFFKWLPQVSMTTFKGLHNIIFVMAIGIFVVNTIC